MIISHKIKGLPRQNNELEDFISHCLIKKHTNPNAIIKTGRHSKTLYYIIHGSVSVAIEDGYSNEIILAYLNPGDFFGEMGLFVDDQKLSACVNTRTHCEIAEIRYCEFIAGVTGSIPVVPTILFSKNRGLQEHLVGPVFCKHYMW